MNKEYCSLCDHFHEVEKIEIHGVKVISCPSIPEAYGGIFINTEHILKRFPLTGD
jgi:hypothetical protein